MQTSQDRVTQGWVGFFVSFAVVLAPTPVLAWQDELSAAIERAKHDVVEVPSSEVERTRQILDAKLASLDSLILTFDEENEWGWREYLYWSELTAELDKDQPELTVLRRTYENLRRKHEGLELRHFTEARKALIDYINALNFTRQENQIDIYVALLDDLKEAIESARNQPSAEAQSLLGRILGTLESAGQVPSLVERVRQEFGHPNLVARVSGDFISRNTVQSVDDTRPVSEMILGSHQTGTAHTVGTVTLETVPNENQAELQAVLSATTSSDNVGRRPVGKLGTVTILSDSSSQATATKQILIDDGELSSLGARACAQTRTNIHQVCAPKLISKIATRQVFRSKSQAEAIASQRLARRLETQFDERVRESLAEANANFTNEVHYPLIRLDAHPEQIRFSTTVDELMMSVVQADGYQIAASTQSPDVQQDADAAVVVHQTAVNNLAEAVFGGKRITDRMAAEWLEVANQGDIPDEFKIDRDNPWSITLAKYQPVAVEFGDSELLVRIRGTRFSRGGDDVNEMIDISAKYAIEKTAKGVKFTRIGEVELTYPLSEQLTVEQTAVKSFLLDKFKVLFKDSAETTGVRFPGRFAEKAPMELSVFQMSQGWLSLAWQQSSEEQVSHNEPTDVARHSEGLETELTPDDHSPVVSRK